MVVNGDMKIHPERQWLDVKFGAAEVIYAKVSDTGLLASDVLEVTHQKRELRRENVEKREWQG